VTTVVTAVIATVIVRQTVTRVRHACTELDRTCKERNVSTIKADSHIACRAHAFPPPCHVAKGLECVFPV
jgi:hypothetical protein